MASNGAKCSQTAIEIKIKTRDYRTFSLQVHKQVPIPELKEQVASVTGVQSGQQRLLCRGIPLEDDQLLSNYNVHDGHALRLIVTELGSSSRLPGEEANLNFFVFQTDAIVDAGHPVYICSRKVGGSVGPQRNNGIRIRTASFEPSGLQAQGHGGRVDSGHQDGGRRNQTRAVPIIGRGTTFSSADGLYDGQASGSGLVQPQVDGEGQSRVEFQVPRSKFGWERVPSGPNMPSSDQGPNFYSQPLVIDDDDDDDDDNDGNPDEGPSSSRRRWWPSKHQGQQRPKRQRR